MVRALLGIAFALFLGLAPQDRPLYIAVVRFRADGVKPELAGAITELVTSLINRPGIKLIEREQISRVIEEQSLAQSDLTRPDTAGEMSRLLDSDFQLLGSISCADGVYVIAARLVDKSGVIRMQGRGSVQFRLVDEMTDKVTELLQRMGLHQTDPRQTRVDLAAARVQAAPGTVQTLLEEPGPRKRSVQIRLSPPRPFVAIGERLEAEVVSDRDGFLALMCVDAEGRASLLVPNRRTGSVAIRKGEPLRVPTGLGFSLRAQAPTGPTWLKAIVTDRCLTLPEGGGKGGDLVRLALGDVLDRGGSTQSSADWGSAETEFTVVERLDAIPPPAPRPAPPVPAAPTADPAASPAPAPEQPAAEPALPTLEAALEDVVRNRRPREDQACALLRWPLDAPASWPGTVAPPSIRWRPLPLDRTPPRIAVVDADFDPDDPVLRRAFADLDPAARESLRAEVRTTEAPRFRHGNRVASLIAGDARWLPSTLPGAPLLPVRVASLSRGPDTDWRVDRGQVRAVLDGIRRAMDAGCRIINLSMKLDPDPGIASDPIWDDLERAGVLLVCAAGNGGEDLDAPGAPYPVGLARSNVLCVGAVDLQGALAKWPLVSQDNRMGGSAFGRRSVHVLAPGVGIPTSDGANGPALAFGTSFAAPLATGVAAAWMALHPEWRPVEVIEAMIRTSAACPGKGTLARGGLLRWPPAAYEAPSEIP